MASAADEVSARRTIDGQRRLGLSTPFSLQVYLPWGKYDHVDLKRAYFKACSNGHGTQFREALYVAHGQGNLTMPKVMSAKLGEEVDFFAAVVAASHNGPLIEGVLEMVGNKESAVSDKPAETDIDKFLGKKKPAKRPVINSGHWRHIDVKRQQFYKDLADFGFNKYGIKGADKPRIIHEALGVAHLEETPLSQSEATKAVLLFIDNKYGRKESDVNAKQIDATRNTVKKLLEGANLPLESYSKATGDANMDASIAANKTPADIINAVKKYCKDHKPAQNSAQEPPKSNGASETPPSANGHAAGDTVSSEPPAETETAETTKLPITSDKPLIIADVLDTKTGEITLFDPNRAIERVKGSVALVNRMFSDAVLVLDVDYGKIPGNDKAKPTLLKPGAEKLLSAFQYYPIFKPTSNSISNWKDGFFNFEYECVIYSRESGRIEGSGIGNCNSMEKKYRYRWVTKDRLPKNSDLASLPQKGSKISELDFAVEKAETTGKYGKPVEYWKQFTEAIAAGTAEKEVREFNSGKKGSAWVIDTTMYGVQNNEIFDLVNTLSKMAQKRALVAATLNATGASAVFTQDQEDFTDFGLMVA